MKTFSITREIWFQSTHNKLVFDYKVLRLFIGTIALTISFVVTIVANEELSSISASYYTASRDVFVGMMCIVGAFLMAYNGHYFYESLASSIAAIATFVVALAPCDCTSIGASTMCDSITVTPAPIAHGTAAAIVFTILAYFCLFPFRHSAEKKPGRAAKIRKWIYIICGITMLSSMAIIMVSKLFELNFPKIVYIGEAAALTAFGIAWITAGRYRYRK